MTKVKAPGWATERERVIARAIFDYYKDSGEVWHLDAEQLHIRINLKIDCFALALAINEALDGMEERK
jgi:hypothetical protein